MNAIDGPSSGRAAPREPVASSERRLEAASSSCAGSWAPRISFAGECRFLDLKAIQDAGFDPAKANAIRKLLRWESGRRTRWQSLDHEPRR